MLFKIDCCLPSSVNLAIDVIVYFYFFEKVFYRESILSSETLITYNKKRYKLSSEGKYTTPHD